MRHAWILVAVLALAAAIHLGYSGWRGAVLYYLTPSEVRGEGRANEGSALRVAGRVLEDSLVWDPAALSLAFEITDGAASIPVLMVGQAPGSVRPGQEVVVEGTVNEAGALVGTRLIVKCPSKYEGATAPGGQAPGSGGQMPAGGGK